MGGGSSASGSLLGSDSAGFAASSHGKFDYVGMGVEGGLEAIGGAPTVEQQFDKEFYDAEVARVLAPVDNTPEIVVTGRRAQNDVVAQIGSIIAKGEGSYNSWNTGTIKGKDGRPHVQHSYPNPRGNYVTSTSMNDIIWSGDNLPATDPERLAFTGKYQTKYTTLESALAAIPDPNLTGEEAYSPAMQERIFREYLIYKAGGGALADYVFDGVGTPQTAQYAAAKEWASIAVPKGYTVSDISGGYISDGTKSYYESLANHANMTSTNQLSKILNSLHR
jgi:hypothetical protein